MEIMAFVDAEVLARPCVDCELDQRQRGVRKPNPTGGARRQQDLRPNLELTANQALAMVGTFGTLVRSHVKKLQDGRTVSQRELEGILDDAADIVLSAATDADLA